MSPYHPESLAGAVLMVEAPLIVIAESQSHSEDHLADVFTRASFRAKTVRTAGEALKLAPEADLAVVDEGMARELLPKLRALVAPQMLPVLTLGSDRVASLEWGADAALGWPADEKELLAWTRALLRLRQRFQLMSDKQRELEELSRTDGLTGLLNHRRLQERLYEEFRRAQRHGDGLSLLMLDLDLFKELNDRCGHQVGDRVLKDISKLIVASVRETDLCARYGGEEFAVLLPRTQLNGALSVAERILKGANVKPIEGQKVTVSIGVACFPSGTLKTPELLVRAADEALYRAKREGRDRICIDREGSVSPLKSLAT
jgi:two-component system cell cycle response regulator